MNTVYENNGVKLTGLECFSLAQIFDCGQCFRFSEISDNLFEGVAFGKLLVALQTSEDSVFLRCTRDDYENIWKHFLALDADYSIIRSSLPTDGTMKLAAECGSGIRILAQDRWEALCSFMISQNNNIPRIKKNISDLCVRYGKPFEENGRTYYSFPTPEEVCSEGVEGLSALKLGFRAPYIYDTAAKIASGGFSLDAVSQADDADALKLLCTLRGVGVKVASCTLLFGFGRYSAFPVDVWVKRILAKYYPDIVDLSYFGKYAGIAQQYLFYRERFTAAN